MGELARERAFRRATIGIAIRDHLTHEPTKVTRNRKPLIGMDPPFDAVPPIWELRVGEVRVFYDVDEEEKTVTVRAIRPKPPHKTTEEIL